RTMSTTAIPPAPAPAPPTTEAKLARRATRTQGLFAPELLRTAFVRSLVMLRPDLMWKNPVMFVVEVGCALSVLYTIAKLFSPGAYVPSLAYLIALDFWLLLTVLFANFAEALAEARGKAQAASLRKTRQEPPAYRLKDPGEYRRALEEDVDVEEVNSTQLDMGEVVLVKAGQVIPGDGEVIAGVATVDESAITGESAPVVREAGTDRSGVTRGATGRAHPLGISSTAR